jgi:hypothetical protein
MIEGQIHKLKTSHEDNLVCYKLPIGSELIDLNTLVGKSFSLKFSGEITCIDTGKVIKKSFGQGYCWESYSTLAECDKCIFQPELCHFDHGTCRDENWGQKHCMQPHIVYLANSSQIKVGITRQTQVPTRWMDQGASFALPFVKVKKRKDSGLIEVKIAKEIGDKTNWRKMLKNEIEDIDLIKMKKKLLSQFKDLLDKYEAEVCDDELYTFHYPVEKYPDKIKSLNFDKNPHIEGQLLGIKGQYLIFDSGVINIRRHQGYHIQLDV